MTNNAKTWLDDLGPGDVVKVCADGHGGSREKTYVMCRTPAGRIVVGGSQYDGRTGRERGGSHYLLPWTAEDEAQLVWNMGPLPMSAEPDPDCTKWGHSF